MVPTRPTPWIGPPAAAAASTTRVVTQLGRHSTSSTKRVCGALEGGIRPAWVVGTVANLTHSEAFLSEAPPAIRTGWSDCEDWGSLVLGFDDGTVAQISAADIVIGGIQNLLTIYAGRAMINVGTNPNNAVLAYAPDGDAFANEYIREKVETKAGWQFTNPDEDWMNGSPHEVQDFCEAAVTGREPISGSFLGRDVVAVCYGAYLSAATGKRVDVPTE